MIARIEEDVPTVESPTTSLGAERNGILAALSRLTAAGSLPVGSPRYEFVQENGSIALRAWRGRVDSLQRADYLLIGALLSNAVLAVRRGGFDCELTLISDRSADNCLARITPTLPAELTDAELRMCAALRGATECPVAPPSSVEWPPLQLFGMLRRVALDSGAWIDLIIDDARRTLVADVVAQAAYVKQLECNAKALAAHYGAGPRARPAAAEREPLQAALPSLGAALHRARGVRESCIRHAIMRSSLLVVIGCDGDSQMAWMRCGMALQRGLLLATAAGLCATLHSEISDYSALRDALRALVIAQGMPQIVVSFSGPVLPSP